MGGKRRRKTQVNPAPKAGRTKGTKNLKRVNGGVINQQGVFFTEKEKKALESAVRKANRNSKAMQEVFNPLMFRREGKEQGYTVESRILTLGKEYDFSIAKKSASLQRFKSKEEYNKYMKNLRRVNSKNYVRDRARQYKNNYKQALTDPIKGLGFAHDDVKDILGKIRNMNPDEYMKMVASNEELEIGYLYDEDSTEATLNRIRSALGLPHKEIDGFWDGDEY